MEVLEVREDVEGPGGPRVDNLEDLGQSKYGKKDLGEKKIIFIFSVGVYVVLFPLFSWLTKRFLRKYSLILNVNILKYFWKFLFFIFDNFRQSTPL